MLKAILVDDEQNSIESLKILIHDFCEGIEVIASASTGNEAIHAIKQYEPDVVFLDINLQDESGFDVLARIEDVNFAIIFATAYSEFAIKAFRYSALDYLLKPIDTVELRQAVEKVKKCKSHRMESKTKVDLLFEHLRSFQASQFSKLAIPSVSGLTFINPEEIMYCEAKSNYTQFHLADGTKHLTSKTLKQIEGLLKYNNFARIHHSYIINLSYLKRYDKGEGVVHLDEKIQLDVSKRRKEEFLSKIIGT